MRIRKATGKENSKAELASVVTEASSLEFSSFLLRAPWSRHTAPGSYDSVLSQPVPSPGQLPALRFLIYSFPAPQPTAPPSSVSLLRPLSSSPPCQSPPSSGLPCSEDPVILLIPAHVCPADPTFPTYLPLMLYVREWSK